MREVLKKRGNTSKKYTPQEILLLRQCHSRIIPTLGYYEIYQKEKFFGIGSILYCVINANKVYDTG